MKVLSGKSLNCGEDFRKVVGCKRYCVFGVDTLGRDYASDGITEIVVKRQNHMYIEDFRKLFSDLAHCCVTQLVQLFKSCLLCRSEPTCFIFCTRVCMQLTVVIFLSNLNACPLTVNAFRLLPLNTFISTPPFKRNRVRS